MFAHKLADPLCHTVVIKDKQRFWKRILIIDDEVDVTRTFKAGIEERNNYKDANKSIEVHTSNNPVIALSEFKPKQLKKLWKDLPPLISFHGGLVPTCNFLIPAPPNGRELSICGAILQESTTARQSTVTGTLNDQSLGQASGYIGIF